FETMQLVGNMQGGEDSNLERIDREGARRNFTHSAINEISEPRQVLGIAIRANVVSLIVDLDSDRGSGGRCSFHTSIIKHRCGHGCHLSSSAISGSSAA